MRAAIIVAISLLLPCLAFPAQALAPARPPALSLSIAPTSMDVTTNGTQPVSVVFNGTATVTMGRFDRYTHTLALSSAVDAGWDSSVSPETLTFTASGTQNFNCTVTIPTAPGNITANITVSGSLTGGGFVVSNSARCLLNVKTSEPDKSLSGQGAGSRNRAAAQNDSTMIFAAAAAVAVIAVVAGVFFYARIARRRKALQP